MGTLEKVAADLALLPQVLGGLKQVREYMSGFDEDWNCHPEYFVALAVYQLQRSYRAAKRLYCHGGPDPDDSTLTSMLAALLAQV